jgi:class 3 adenylate cyclase/tetratricopeptide (TPR) repeat protein
MTCPQCRQPSAPTARFCSHCGAKLEIRCRACDAENTPGSRFCSACGAALDYTRVEPAARATAYTPEHLAARILTSRAAIEGERKHVTILLADLKGSMELVADRDPEEARRLLDPVLQHMIDAVHHYEGTVNQVMGDGIMALFGAPIGHEDHALRGCYAALRMQESVGRYGDELQRSHGVPVQIRVGLNSGDVVVRSIGSDLHMDYTAVGQTTHLAGRMEQMARPGSILLTSATLALVEGYVRVRALGAAPIKGLTDSVEVFELLGGDSARTRLQVAAGRGLTRFIGRDAEMEQLRAAIERAARGQGQVVALIGEPGIGKSRLVWELVHSHRTQGWLVLQASAVAYGRSMSFLPVAQLVKAYLGIEDGDDARRVREKLTGKLLTLDETLRSALAAFQVLLDLPVDDPAWKTLGDRERQRIVEAVRSLLLRESEVQPLLLVLEDLHWIDTDTQALLESLVEGVPSNRVLLLINYRPEYRHDWGNKTYYGQIRLDPLPPESAENLLETLLGPAAASAPLTARLIEQTQGNPFFLEETVQSLAETGVLTGERGAYRLARPVGSLRVPATVQAILAARIDRLPPEEKSLLQSAAVIGNEVPLALLREIADRSEDELARTLARLRAGEFLYEARLFPDVEYTFKHALTHEVAYASLLHERRRDLHARLVDAIERAYPGRVGEQRDRLVHHAFRGEVWGKALTHLRDLNALASPDDIGKVMGSGPENPGQLWWSGEHERAVRAAERDLAVAASFGNFTSRIVGTCRLGQAHHALGDYGMAANLFRQVSATLQGDLVHEHFGMAALPAVWARSWLAWSQAERGEFGEALAAAEEAVAIAEERKHAYSGVQAAFGLGTVYVIQGCGDLAIPVFERALVMARVENIPVLIPFLSGPLGVAYMLDDRVDLALSMLEQTIEQALAVRLVANHSLRLVWLGEALSLARRRERATEIAGRALQLAEERRERGSQAYARALVAALAADSAAPDLASADTAYHEALAAATALEMRPLAGQCRLGLGRLHRRLGRPEVATAHLREAAAIFEATGMSRRLADADAELGLLERAR